MPEVDIPPGEDAAHIALNGPRGFLSKTRLKKYSTGRNNPADGEVCFPSRLCSKCVSITRSSHVGCFGTSASMCSAREAGQSSKTSMLNTP